MFKEVLKLVYVLLKPYIYLYLKHTISGLIVLFETVDVVDKIFKFC